MHFPIFVDLTEKNILIVGGGKIAARRIRSLTGFAKHMTVVAPQVSEDILKLAEEGTKEEKAEEKIEAAAEDSVIEIIYKFFEAGDLSGKDLVLAATNDAKVNRKIYEECKARGIAVNVCTDQSLCDFQFPSIVVDQDVVIGLNASGQNHHRVKELRQELEEFLEVDDENKKYR